MKYYSKARTFLLMILVILAPVTSFADKEDQYSLGNSYFRSGKYREAMRHILFSVFPMLVGECIGRR
jgi:hypothetical protein